MSKLKDIYGNPITNQPSVYQCRDGTEETLEYDSDAELWRGKVFGYLYDDKDERGHFVGTCECCDHVKDIVKFVRTAK